MKRLNLLLLFVVLSFVAMAQKYPKHAQYVKLGSSTAWHSAYENWQPGTSLYNGTEDAVNEQFFISRVKPRERFNFTETQVKEDLNPERKMLWWCPIGENIDKNWNALPTYSFEGEVYSMWSYTDIWSNWTAPLIQAPAAFLDACHKNGVRSGVVAVVPYAASPSMNDGGHGSNISSLYNGGSDKLLKYLRYYGVDAIGFYSEFSWANLNMSSFRNLMGDCYANADKYGVPFSNVWYSFTTNTGSIGDMSVLNNNCVDWFDYNGKKVSDAYFLNYNWSAGALNTSQTTASNKGRSSFDVYAGMDFYGHSQAYWTILKDYNISFGLWGAHEMNMLFENRGELGSMFKQKQKTYQLISENVFTGSSFNPVNAPEIKNVLRHTSKATDFHGFSSFITARSTMMSQYGNGTLADDPFVTYFNLGNGMFFNENGETTFNNEWYNLGMQDYMPTWRWWWTKNFMGKEASDASTDMTAEFTWDDAWFGGSCLQITGATECAYLQLFKTKYAVKTNDVVKIRYKVVSGTGTICFTLSTEDDPKTEINAVVERNTKAGADVWYEKEIKVVGRYGFNINGKTIALMGLKFEDTSSDFKVLIGEISLTSGTSVTPDKPIVTMSKAMARNYKGVDMKVVFDMTSNFLGNRQEYETIYNSDVKTWFYKIYTQQEGEEPVLCTATTSWAAYVVGAPYDFEKGGKIRIGVSAVSMDGKSESDTAWSEWLTAPASQVVEGFSIDKPIIKAGEEFTVAFDDPTHPAATWVIKSSTDDAVKGTFNASSFTTSLAEEGIYDLYVTIDGVTEKHRGRIQISPAEVGAMPQIKSFKIVGEYTDSLISHDYNTEFEYIGRDNCDGYVSRGLSLNERAFGIPADQLDFTTETPFTLTFWFKVNKFNHESSGTQFVNIRSVADGWPASDWGYLWSQFSVEQNSTKENELDISFRTMSSAGYGPVFSEEIVFEEEVWYHMAFVFGFNNTRTMKIYLNGKKVCDYTEKYNVYQWKSSNVIMIGGRAFARAGLNGVLDEVRLYNKELSVDEVKSTMLHAENITDSNFIGYWDFESDANENNNLLSTGYNKELVAGIYEIVTLTEGTNEYVPQEISFAAGAPFISGVNYKIETLPTWKFKGATIISSSGDGTSGEASVLYDAYGTYPVTLILENSWGSDTKSIDIAVVKPQGIEDPSLSEMQAFPNPFENEVYLKFVESGDYTIELYDYSGRLINSSLLSANEGEIINIPVNGQSGIYFIKVRGEAGLLNVMKVIKK